MPASGSTMGNFSSIIAFVISLMDNYTYFIGIFITHIQGHGRDHDRLNVRFVILLGQFCSCSYSETVLIIKVIIYLLILESW